MCDPVSMTMAGISAAGAIAAHMEQQKTANAQQKAVEHGSELETAALGRQYEEQGAVAQENMGERARQHLQDLGRLKAIAADTGAAGASTDRILDEESNSTGRDIVTIQQNSRRATEQAHAGGLSQQAQASNMLANIRRPSALGTGLQIAGIGAGAYAQYADGKRQVADAYERSPGFVGPAGYLRNK